MKKIVKADEIETTLQEAKTQNKKIVLVGGYFDILHKAHVALLAEAKKHGDILVVLLESDASAKKHKGEHRPIHVQEDRAAVLSALEAVDVICLLPTVMSDVAYDDLVSKIHPNVLATTKGDPSRIHKERQAKRVGATVIDVIDHVDNTSTTKIAEIIKEQFHI